MKILVSAFACRPKAGSEWHVGWQTVQTLAAGHDLWVMTQAFNREGIEEYLAEHGNPQGIRFFYLGRKRNWHENRLIARMQDWQELRLWTREAAALAAKLSREVEFDLGHHVTIATWRVPAPLAVVDFPWVWGPVGGGTNVKPAFLPLLSRSAAAFELVRGLANKTALRDRRLRACAHSASVCVANSHDMAGLFLKLGVAAGRLQTFSQTFLSGRRFVELECPDKGFPRSGGTLKIIACGTLEGLKGVALTLKALKACLGRGLKFEYRFLGKGSEEAHLRQLAGRLGLADHAHIGEWLSGDQYDDALKSAHVYLSPSLREGVPVALIEAMAAGCVPVVANCGGPGLVVSHECGMPIDVTTPQEMVKSITDALVHLAQAPDTCSRLSVQARTRVAAHFGEDAYQRNITNTYQLAVNLGSPKMERNPG